MSYKKLIALIEAIVISLIIVFHLIPHWNNKYTTPGDLACLEIIALLSYGIYDNLKNKVK